MFKKIAMLVAVALTLSGCANHMPQETVAARSIDRELVSRQVSISLDQGEVLTRDLLKVKGTEAKTFQVRELNNTKVYDTFTPYQGLREFYELPAGIIATAGGVVINVVDFALLGLLPDSFTDGALNVGLAGMNPFLNIESESRKELELAAENEELLDEKLERIELPLAGRSLTVSALEGSRSLELNENGEGSLSLLQLFEALPLSRELTFSLEAEDARAEVGAKLSRQLQANLFRAQKILAGYGGDAGQQGAPDVPTAVEDVLALSKLGFENASQNLEDRILVQLDLPGQEAFLTALMEPEAVSEKGEGEAPEATAEVAEEPSAGMESESAPPGTAAEEVALPEEPAEVKAEAEAAAQEVEEAL